jgi:hypothetical protein
VISVRFQAFPDCIQQFRLLRREEAVYLLSQIAHMPITQRGFPVSGKRTLGILPGSWCCLFLLDLFGRLPTHAKPESARLNCAER